MLIIEGTDLVGKTTFAKTLVDELRNDGYIYKHFSRLPETFDYYWGYRDNAVRRSVQDRYHMSEIAYSMARGDIPKIDPLGYHLIDGALRNYGAFTVVITAEAELIKQRWGRDEMYNLEQVLYANSLFDDVVNAGFPGYPNIDVQAHIHCNADKPFPDPIDLEQVLVGYRAYQWRVDLLHNRRREKWIGTL